MRRTWWISGLLALLAGCGGGNTVSMSNPVEASHAAALAEVGEMLTARKNDNKPPPKGPADLAPLSVGWPAGGDLIQKGQVEVVWGARVDDAAADKVIAFEKQAPESGGFVLMQDGKTVKKMSSDEFKAAPKAPKG